MMASHMIAAAVLFDPHQAIRTLLCFILHVIFRFAPALRVSLSLQFFASHAFMRFIIALRTEARAAVRASN